MENVIFAFFKEAHNHANGNVYTPIFKITEQAAVKASLTGRVDELLDDKMYMLAESQEFIQGLIRHLIKS